MNFYCNFCFKKSDYKFSKPKFCPNCGVGTSGALPSNVINSDSKSFQKGESLPSCLQASNTNKIQELERKLAAYERINLAEKVAKKHEVGRSSENNEFEDEAFDSKWNGSIDSLRGTVQIQFDRSGKEGVKFSDVAGSSGGAQDAIGGDFSRNRQEDISQENYDRILQELKEESSSGARIINID